MAVLAATVLAAPSALAQPPSADDSRAQAREILQERRFRGSEIPRPFAGIVRWLGERLQPVADFVEDLSVRVPGGPPVFVAILVLLAATLLARGSIRRRAAAAARAARARSPARDDPDDLERDADRAAAAGEWETAVRLRFRAGLLRLDARDAIEYRPSLTTGEVRRAIFSPAFDRVGSDFDEIAYGGRPAKEADAEASREGWARVLSETGHRGPAEQHAVSRAGAA